MNNQDPSYKKVNYLLRLRKQIERKIIIETLQSLSQHPKIKICEYSYFGLGSIYFADFILFHKYLKIEDMISIDKAIDEKGRDNKRRFIFNRPYKLIKFEKAFSTEYMKSGKLNWKKPLLIWLDYDSRLTIDNKFIIEDLDIVARNVEPYDIFITTMECDFRGDEEKLRLILDRDIKKFLPIDIEVKDLDPSELPKTFNYFVRACVENGLTNNQKTTFLQIFNFNYKDTANMYTFGCIFLKQDKNVVKDFGDFCKENKITIYSADDEPERIDCPIITPKEKCHLDSVIDIKNGQIISDFKMGRKTTGLFKEEIEKYQKYSALSG